MKKQRYLLIFLFLLCPGYLFSQGFLLTEPKLQFDGYKLTITYDIVTKGKSDIFSIWVEMRDQDGDPIRAYAIKGDMGDSIKPGNNKIITWIPEEDAIFLDEDVTVEVKGELFERTFNKGAMVLYSAVVPGLGQTKTSEGKPWWLASLPAYGALAGGIIFYTKYSTNYNAYINYTGGDSIERQDLYNQAVKERNLSSIMLITSGVIWAANLVWMAAKNNRYKPLQHARISFNSVPFNNDRHAWITFKVDF